MITRYTILLRLVGKVIGYLSNIMISWFCDPLTANFQFSELRSLLEFGGRNLISLTVKQSKILFVVHNMDSYYTLICKFCAHSFIYNSTLNKCLQIMNEIFQYKQIFIYEKKCPVRKMWYNIRFNYIHTTITL